MSLDTWLLLLCCVAVVSSVRVSVVVGGEIKFPLTENCALRGAELVQVYRTKRKVASFNGSIWTPAPDYEDRMTPGTSVVLNRAFKNDEGHYETGCDRFPTVLDVVQSQVVEVPEGAAATLPCYFITTGHESVLWERDLNPVFEMNLSSNQTKYGTGFDHRVVLSSGFLQGNLSLTLNQTQLNDAGVYFCFMKDEHGKKPLSPGAVKLTVNKVNLDPNNTGTNTTTLISEACVNWWWIILTIVLTSLVWSLLAFLGPRVKKRCEQRPQDDTRREYHVANSDVQLSTTNN